MTMVTLFIAQTTNIELTLTQQLVILGVAMIISKSVAGAAFVAVVATCVISRREGQLDREQLTERARGRPRAGLARLLRTYHLA